MHAHCGSSLAALIFSGWTEASNTNILLRNVSLIDVGDCSQSRTVNIFIQKGHLDLVSEDPMPVDAATQNFEAANGAVLGSLGLGEPASFIILDGDPREDVEILLDTRQHADFAISKGEILRNRLEASVAEIPAYTGRAEGALAGVRAPTVGGPAQLR
jgi:phosphate-selective porin OprO/OprP